MVQREEQWLKDVHLIRRYRFHRNLFRQWKDQTFVHGASLAESGLQADPPLHLTHSQAASQSSRRSGTNTKLHKSSTSGEAAQIIAGRDQDSRICQQVAGKPAAGTKIKAKRQAKQTTKATLARAKQMGPGKTISTEDSLVMKTVNNAQSDAISRPNRGKKITSKV